MIDNLLLKKVPSSLLFSWVHLDLDKADINVASVMILLKIKKKNNELIIMKTVHCWLESI